ncbi:pilus assembly PilX family protein [Marinobacterium weihaiense]|uniref:Pilus assembly PilX N-terminal domain-containing protein n=1 Tax=Marinobacterium weihaiense TaxID=2851016 RepID=A0ABS6M9N1_9GAMM|nr:pilus assembly PilX N-terminal domain-containing protein [Marinobacterium weihaiense]MBV0932993.1 pilus assembly PilX N-terminal domain-containing protein [Marinobacterium weihaiense]
MLKHGVRRPVHEPLCIRQRGMVLLVGMIFLLVLTVIGVSLMTGATQDERLSGNSKRSSDAFLAAEAGSKAAITELCTEYVDENGYGGGQNYCDPDENKMDEAINPPEWFYYACRCVDDCSASNVSDRTYALVTPEGTVIGENDTVYLYQDEVFANADSDNPALKSTFSVSLGRCEPKNGELEGALETLSLISEGKQSNAERKIHFNLGQSSGGGDVSWPAVFVNDDPDDPDCDFDFGPSNSYLYDGRGGPAISTNTKACADQIRNADDGEGQLKGGVVVNNPEPDFTSPGGQEKFFAALDAYTPSDRKVFGEPDSNPNKNMVVVKQDLPKDLGTPGDPSSMKTTIIYGNLNITGGLSGAGILVVTGEANFGGTPHWDGIIMVLGGHVDIGGGGAANGLDGTLIVSNIDFGDDDPYKPGPWNDHKDDERDFTDDDWESRWDYDADDPTINWDVSGGGNALYNYGCQNMIDAANSLPSGVSFPAPSSCPDVSGDGTGEGAGYNGTFGRLYVFDWLEEVDN